jgi:predicted ATPase/class 3 adenylate cyclase
MYHLIPYFIQHNFARGQLQGEFEAAGLFVDISGFSAMTEALMTHGPHGAEVLVEVMRSVFDPFMTCVYGHKGIVITIQGDSFTALFPLTGEGVEQAALAEAGVRLQYQHAFSAAWMIKEHLEGDDHVETPYGSFTIQVKIGLAAGRVRWGIVTSKGDGLLASTATYYFQGTAVDGCAETGNAAQPGEIIMDAGVTEQVSDLVSAEPVGTYFRARHLTGEILPAQSFDLPSADPHILKLFFPASLLAQSSSGEFRQVVNVFINLPTIRNEAQLAVFLDTLFSLTRRYGGLFKRVDFGDKGSSLLLFWGVPVTYENDVERALNFILDLQSLTSIPIHAGVTYQIAHAGFIRSSLFEEYTCYGWGLNLAARFMTAARRGEVWVDERIAERARAHYELEDDGEKSFKGFSRKQRVFILRERKQELAPFFSGEMVGRLGEIRQLEKFVAPLWEGKFAGALVVWGEPGIGKSRLVHEFQESGVFQNRQVLWALCQSDEILRQPLNPVQYWLFRFFKQSEAQAEWRNKRSFNEILDNLIEQTAKIQTDLADELDRTRSFLGGLINLTWNDSLYEQLDPQGRNENITIAVMSLIKAASLLQPLVMILEDVHLLDEESQNLLPRLVRGILSDERSSYPIALISTARSDAPRDVLGVGVAYNEIVLTGISRQGMADLAASRLGKPVSTGLLDLLMEHAEGNPFFGEQILSYLVEGGFLVQEQNEWRLLPSVSLAPLPVDVRALLVSRIDRLDTDVKNVVQAASVIGREFEYPLLAQVVQEEGLQRKVEAATEASIWTLLVEVRYLFKHSLLRDVAYSMLLLSRRKQFHDQIVTVMENLYAAELNQHYGELAFHSEQAEVHEKARKYLRLAGDLARDVYRNNLAVSYYSRALALTPENDPISRFELVLEREALYNLLGNHEAQQHDLELLDHILTQAGGWLSPEERLVRESLVYNRRAGFATHTGDYQEAAVYAQKALSIAQDAGADGERIDACLNWALALYRQAQYEQALELIEESIQLARQEDNFTRLGRLLNMYGLIAMDCREPASVSRFLEESQQIARKTNNLVEEALVLNNLGNLAGAVGDYSQAQAYYQQSLEIAQKIGHRRGEGLINGNLGWIAGSLGDYAASRAYCEQNLRINREVGSLEGEAYALINLGSACIYLGENSQALSYLSRALAIALQTDDHSAKAWALTYAGHAHQNCGELLAAREDYLQALEIRRQLKQPNLSTEPLAGLARIALEMEELPPAMTNISEIMDYLDAGGTLDGCDEPLRVYLSCYQVLRQAGDSRTVRVLETAYKTLMSRAEKIQDLEMRNSFLINVPYHNAIIGGWQKQGDAS